MTNEEVKDILHKAFEVYIDSLSGDENFTDKQLEVLTANKIIGKALEHPNALDVVMSIFNGEEPCSFSYIDLCCDEWCDIHCSKHIARECWEHALIEGWWKR